LLTHHYSMLNSGFFWHTLDGVGPHSSSTLTVLKAWVESKDTQRVRCVLWRTMLQGHHSPCCHHRSASHLIYSKRHSAVHPFASVPPGHHLHTHFPRLLPGETGIDTHILTLKYCSMQYTFSCCDHNSMWLLNVKVLPHSLLSTLHSLQWGCLAWSSLFLKENPVLGHYATHYTFKAPSWTRLSNPTSNCCCLPYYWY